MTNRTYSRIFAVGRLAKDSNQTMGNDGRSAIHFPLAVNHGMKQKDGSWKDEATFFNVDWWRKSEEQLQYHKGEIVAVSGEVMMRSYRDRNGEEQKILAIRADEVTSFIERKDTASSPYQPATKNRQPQPSSTAQQVAGQFGGKVESVETFADDDIPF